MPTRSLSRWLKQRIGLSQLLALAQVCWRSCTHAASDDVRYGFVSCALLLQPRINQLHIQLFEHHARKEHHDGRRFIRAWPFHETLGGLVARCAGTALEQCRNKSIYVSQSAFQTDINSASPAANGLVNTKKLCDAGVIEGKIVLLRDPPPPPPPPPPTDWTDLCPDLEECAPSGPRRPAPVFK